MISNFLRLLASVAIVIYLAGCEQRKPHLDYHAAQQELRVLNSLLLPSGLSVNNHIFPFSEAYLKLRHSAYQQLDETGLTSAQLQELNYLKIQERYPERYLPWPAQVNVISNAKQQGVDSASISQWMQLVVEKLESAKDSNIHLSRIELNRLKGYLAGQPEGQVLLNYLDDYKPRSGIGLYQLPNGKEWYQSKLNFYYGKPIAPNKLLTKLQQRLVTGGGTSANVLSFDESESVALSLIKRLCSPQRGLNWLDGYVNLPETLSSCQPKLSLHDQHALLALMEVDLGVHYQGWSYKQAKVTLQARIELTDQQALSLVENVVLHPASVLVFLASL
ncbi:hypothetical protein [Pseudoalteromonas sp. MMG022]|uniref:hypothetical protein n=1 Tax=Pseudoalteromonas sp. MMG022 TaxID=2909978 RepID=UPI001F362951|nr:hypothetical protein [Pseudoalteromonas sp. MMG022]MCF6435109.1 hypothetical protein [Pseudoalteromonas sp. MMG022]